MPPAKKRRTETSVEPIGETEAEEHSQPQSQPQRQPEQDSPVATPNNAVAPPSTTPMDISPPNDGNTPSEAAPPAPPSIKLSVAPHHQPLQPSLPTAASASAQASRLARFAALKARAKTSSNANLKAATQETQRLAANPAALTAIQRKSASAAAKLLRAETEDGGEDFERKRAWDWTIDESEAWDEHMAEKKAARDRVAFADYRDEAAKVYERQLKNLHTGPGGGGGGGPDLEKYDRAKMEALEKAARAGQLEIVETEDGETVAVDKSGDFFADADATSFSQHKPDREAVRRVVDDVNRADDQRMKKRRERMARNGEDTGGDATYINEKNKQFNQKLARYYNKYTAEIRDSFERGTMI